MLIPMKLLARTVRHAPLLSVEARDRSERWLRGREEARALARADCAVVSPAKSGRTWLRVMLTRYFQTSRGLPEGVLLDGENMRRLDSSVPSVLFTHDNLIRNYLGAGATAAFKRKAVVLLVRHPADVAVSSYFHWRHRMTPAKRALKGLPPVEVDPPIYDFIMREPGMLMTIIAFMNRWASEMRDHPSLIVVRYEDMRAEPESELERVLRFMGQSPTREALSDAVNYASLENMRALEASDAFAISGRALRATGSSEADASKVRRGKISGYTDYFESVQLGEIELCINCKLDPVFGYDRPLASRDPVR